MSGLLPVLAVALCAGIVAADRAWVATQPALLVAVIALGAGPVLLRGARARVALAVLACACAGAASLGSRLDSAARHRPVNEVEVDVAAQVCAVTRAADGWASAQLCRVTRLDLAASAVPEHVLLSGHADDAGPWIASLLPGQRVAARLRLRPLRGLANPGGHTRIRALARHGVSARAWLVDPRIAVKIVGLAGPGLRERVERLRLRISGRLVHAGPGGALLSALAVGERGALDRGARQDFSELGIAHLLAVSGLHLALVAGLVFSLARRLLVRLTPLAAGRDPRGVAALAALMFAMGYAALCGWGLPIRRALVFLAALAAAVLLGRRSGPGHLLAAAALVVLSFEPGALFELGAQLSFVASAALLFSRRDPRGHPPDDRVGLRSALRVGARSSSVAIAATAPVLAAHGLGVGPFAVLANVVSVPWTALVLLPVSLLAATAAGLSSGETAQWIGSLAELAAGGTLRAAHWAASNLPDSGGAAGSPAWAIAFAAAIAMFSVRLSGTGVRVALAVGGSLMLRIAPPPAIVPPPPRLVSLDVGSGDATLVQGRRGVLLVDGARAVSGRIDLGRSVVVPALRALGVERLDLLVASHADVDHSGGLVAVLEAVPVGALWLPAGAFDERAFDFLRGVARRANVRVSEHGAGDPAWAVGDLSVLPLWPPRAASEVAGLSRNDRSLLLRVEIEGRRVLLAGDLGTTAEARLLTAGVDLRADVLKVGHHGSRTSSGLAFLRAVEAEVALVSAPCQSSRGLPNPEVLKRIHGQGTALWWTGRDGALFVKLRDPLSVWGRSLGGSCTPRPAGER